MAVIPFHVTAHGFVFCDLTCGQKKEVIGVDLIIFEGFAAFRHSLPDENEIMHGLSVYRDGESKFVKICFYLVDLKKLIDRGVEGGKSCFKMVFG